MDARKGHPPRLKTWDYSSPAAYFVTFKVADRRPVLGSVDGDSVELSDAGRIVLACQQKLPERFPVRLDTTVVMPNHVHAVIILEGETERCGAESRDFVPMMRDPASMLGKVVRAWKASSTIGIRRSCAPDFAWQSRYYEHVLRTDRELERVRAYIEGNPRRWAERAAGERGGPAETGESPLALINQGPTTA